MFKTANNVSKANNLLLLVFGMLFERTFNKNLKLWDGYYL